MKISKEQIDNVVDRLSIYDVVKEDVNLKSSGSDYIGLCPFHNDHNPSFRVSPRKNICKCFSCGEGGSPVTYFMKRQGCDFVSAIRLLATKVGVEIKEQEETEEERVIRQHRESLVSLNHRVFKFYQLELEKEPDAIAYLENRVSENFREHYDFGFAPNKRDILFSWAKANNENIDNLKELGWLRDNESGWIEDTVTNRIIAPVNDPYENQLGYVARSLSKDSYVLSKWKYINSPENDIFKKREIVFGLDRAKTEARKKGIMFLVEGTFDAIKMWSVGIQNVVASLGGEWSEAQLKLINRYCKSVCFINDADKIESGKLWGHGIDFVLKNGAKAIKIGLNVSVRELSTLPGNKKQDPASFFVTSSRLNDLLEENFILWFARKQFSLGTSTPHIQKVMHDVAGLVSYIKDEVDADYILTELNKIYRSKDIWRKYIKQAKAKRREEEKDSHRSKYEEYGFIVKNGCYYGNKGNTDGEWSNFIMTPLFHIKDNDTPRRIFQITNVNGESDIVDFTMDELCSLGKLKQKLEGLGNYMWMTSESNFAKVKRYLFDNTKVALPIKQMGWNPHGFYAYGNTVWRNGVFYETDQYGMCTLEDGTKWYIPAASPIYKNNEMYYELEKRFIYRKNTYITAESFMKEFVDVFGDNGMFGLCFYLATLFHDIIRTKTRKFPILNLCGPKGTGKTEMGNALMSLFGAGNKAPNLRNATIPALNYDIGLLSNALFHVDEYKNTLKPELIEFLKGLYDCIGRKKMGGVNFESSIMTSVKCGVIMSGQEVPIADVALLHRCIFLHFSKADFSQKELDRFNEFYEKYKNGVTHINIEFLEHRDEFEANFVENYNIVLRDIMNGTENMGLEARITENWARIIASFLCLEGYVKFPFSYEYLLTCAIDLIVKQNGQCRKNDEISKFWKNFRFLIAEGLIFERADYQIKTLSDFKPVRGTTKIFDHPTQVLMLNPARVFNLAYKAGYTAGDKPIDNETLELYMGNAPEFLGKKASVRFDKIINGVTQYTSDEKGRKVKDQSVLQAYVFNIELLSEKYGFEFGSDTNEYLVNSEGKVEEINFLDSSS